MSEDKDLLQERQSAVAEAEKIFRDTREGANPLASNYDKEKDPNVLKIKEIFSDIKNTLEADHVTPGSGGSPLPYKLADGDKILASYPDPGHIQLSLSSLNKGFYDAFWLTDGTLSYNRKKPMFEDGEDHKIEESTIGINNEILNPELGIERVENATKLLKKAIEEKIGSTIPPVEARASIFEKLENEDAPHLEIQQLAKNCFLTIEAILERQNSEAIEGTLEFRNGEKIEFGTPDTEAETIVLTKVEINNEDKTKREKRLRVTKSGNADYQIVTVNEDPNTEEHIINPQRGHFAVGEKVLGEDVLKQGLNEFAAILASTNEVTITPAKMTMNEYAEIPQLPSVEEDAAERPLALPAPKEQKKHWWRRLFG